MHKKSTVQLHTNRSIPIIGLGTWQLKKETTEIILHAIDDLGYRLIDTSSDYGTQVAIGEAIKKSKIPRENLYIVTKIEETDEAFSAAQNYIKEMQLDYADLILIHRPPTSGAGEDLWRGLIKAKAAGITKDIGVSNYSTTLIEKLISATGEVPAVNQIEWSPFGHSKKMFRYCEENRITIQAYSPLTRATRLDDEALIELAKEYNKLPAQIMLRWSLQSGVIPIPKANQRFHLEENIDVFDFEISAEDMEFLDNFNERYSALGELPYE